MMSHFVVAGDAVVDGGDRRHARAPTAGQQRYHQLAHFVGISQSFDDDRLLITALSRVINL